MLRWELLFCIIKDRKRKTQQKIVDINLSCLQILNIWWKIESWVIDLKNECFIRKNDDICSFQLNIFFWFQFLDNEWTVIFALFVGRMLGWKNICFCLVADEHQSNTVCHNDEELFCNYQQSKCNELWSIHWPKFPCLANINTWWCMH